MLVTFGAAWTLRGRVKQCGKMTTCAGVQTSHPSGHPGASKPFFTILFLLFFLVFCSQMDKFILDYITVLIWTRTSIENCYATFSRKC
jgi:hypothetical protein